MQNEQNSNVAQPTIVEESTQHSAVSIQSQNNNVNYNESFRTEEPVAQKKAVSGQDILAALREMAERLGRYPSMPELTQAHPEIKMGTVRKYFAGYGDALREAGFEGGGCGYTVTMDGLFRDWARLARKYQRCPTMSEYERESKYSVRPLVGRFRLWSQVPRGLHGYAEQKELDVEFGDVLEMIREHYGERPLPLRTRRNTEEKQTSPLINTDDTDRDKNCQECQKCQKIQGLPRIAADERRSGVLTAEARRRGEDDTCQRSSPVIHTDDTDHRPRLANSNWESARQNQAPAALKDRETEETEANESTAVIARGGQAARVRRTFDPRTWQAREVRPRRAPILPDRPIFGAPMAETALACGPTNENGVIFLFGSLARELGFAVMRIQTEFPDCLALRYIGDDRWQLIRIEFEYESRNFLKHMHDPKGCDLIVCWVHNWKECPIEVVELREILKSQNL
jgi:Homing endonuclease associated repeat